MDRDDHTSHTAPTLLPSKEFSRSAALKAGDQRSRSKKGAQPAPSTPKRAGGRTFHLYTNRCLPDPACNIPLA